MKTSSKIILTAVLFTAIGTTYGQAPSAGDKEFVAKVSQGGMFEVAAGRLGIAKGSAQDVRDFATAEVHDHTLVGDKLKEISTKAGITFSATLNADFSAKLQHLSSLSGHAFDEAYLDAMAKLHDIDGAAFDKESSQGGTPAFRAFGAETHRIVLRHIGAIKAAPAE